MVRSLLKKGRTPMVLTGLIFFVTSLLASYIIIAVVTQRAFSIPSSSIPLNEANSDSSTLGGEAFGRGEGTLFVGVFVGPRPGATDVSLDTVIYVDQSRPVSVDLHVDPEVSIWQIKEKFEPPASRVTILCPAELLQPNTTYNVSGSIMGLPAWWTFTTGSSVIPQPEYEFVLSPYTWYVTIAAASVTTAIFALTLLRSQHKLNKQILGD